METMTIKIDGIELYVEYEIHEPYENRSLTSGSIEIHSAEWDGVNVWPLLKNIDALYDKIAEMIFERL